MNHVMIFRYMIEKTNPELNHIEEITSRVQSEMKHFSLSNQRVVNIQSLLGEQITFKANQGRDNVQRSFTLWKEFILRVLSEKRIFLTSSQSSYCREDITGSVQSEIKIYINNQIREQESKQRRYIHSPIREDVTWTVQSESGAERMLNQKRQYIQHQFLEEMIFTIFEIIVHSPIREQIISTVQSEKRPCLVSSQISHSEAQPEVIIFIGQSEKSFY